jgi:hypothetical protein
MRVKNVNMIVTIALWTNIICLLVPDMSGSKGKRSKTTYEGIHNVGNKNRHINFVADGSPYGDQVN